jgi:hypothetical protein
LVLIATASAQSPGPPIYQQIATIPIPGGLFSFDITWADPGSEMYYVADRTLTSGTGRIDVIDTAHAKLVTQITGFVGTVPGGVHSGPNGVVAIPQLNQLYVGDGDSTVKVVDLVKQAVIATISTGGTARADELAYDPLHHIIMITNPNDSPPYVTFISADTQKVLGKYVYQGRQGGLEQPAWDRLTKRFYMSVPSTATDIGSIDQFNPVTMQVERRIFTPACSPAGLVITPSQKMFTSCGSVVDARTGNTLGTIFGVSGDEIWYNPGENRVYYGGATTVVVDADTNQIIATIPNSGRNLAVDSENGEIFAPIPGVGVAVFAAQ